MLYLNKNGSTWGIAIVLQNTSTEYITQIWKQKEGWETLLVNL